MFDTVEHLGGAIGLKQLYTITSETLLAIPIDKAILLG